jgi:hypothetical protein
VYAQPNTTIAVLSTTTTDGHGDVVDTATASATGVPALLLAGTKRVWLPDSGTVRQVGYWTAFVPSTTSVEVGDRVRDERSEQVYVVSGVLVPASSLTVFDAILDLQKV